MLHRQPRTAGGASPDPSGNFLVQGLRGMPEAAELDLVVHSLGLQGQVVLVSVTLALILSAIEALKAVDAAAV